MAETLESKSLETNLPSCKEVPNESDVLQEKSSSSSKSDSDSDSDSDSEEEAQENLQTLELELSNNPSNYDTHLQYIKLLRRLGEIEKLRVAREDMSSLFPLTPEMWQEWARDEASLSTRPESFPVIEKLYERGVVDYLSVSLWCDYLNYVQERDPSVSECSDAGISKARNLFESALTAAGLHVAEGSKIWEAYREFEQAILLTIHEANTEAKEKQVQRIRSIFHRQLSVPLCNLKSTLLAYKVWEVEQGNVLDINSNDLDGVSSRVASAYRKALGMYDARVHLEEQISRRDIPNPERLPQFMNYLKFEQSSGDPSRVQNLYERAITEFPISSDLWLDYTHYLDTTLKVANVIRGVYSRATRNCPWVGKLWIGYLLSLERSHASEEEICAVFEKSLQCTFSSLEEYLDLFLTRIDGLRRRISQASEADGVLDYALIRNTFQHASDYLSPQLQNTGDLLRLYAYWARLELNLGKDLTAARGVWECLLKISGSMLEAWQGYIAMEIEMGHINEARSIFRRCYSKRLIGSGSGDICNSWLRFEREFGTLEDFDHAVQKVTPRLEELALFRLQQQECRGVGGSTDERAIPNKKREKRKADSNVTDVQPPPKRQKDKVQGASGKVVKAEAHNSVESNEIKSINERPESTNEGEIKDSNPPKTRPYTDQCTAFISNLSFQANYDHVSDFFSDGGGIVGIRILKDKFSGKSRGLAYVDFCDDAHLAAALTKNRKKLLGKNISIVRSNPKERKKKEAPIAEHVKKGADDSEAQTQSFGKRRPEGNKGKNTFAVPRTVARPLGWTSNKPKPDQEEPKSNDEFRKMFLKG